MWKADRQLLCLMPSEETIPHFSTYGGTFLIKEEDPVLMETTLLKLMSPDSFLLFLTRLLEHDEVPM